MLLFTRVRKYRYRIILYSYSYLCQWDNLNRVVFVPLLWPLGRKSYTKETIYIALYLYFYLWSEKNYIVLGSYLYLWDGDNLYCIVFILIEVRLFILYSNLYLYLWEETICDTTLGVAAPIIRSAAANSYMYDIHYIHIIHTYSYIEFIYYTYVITYRATFNNKLTTPWVWL